MTGRERRTATSPFEEPAGGGARPLEVKRVLYWIYSARIVVCLAVYGVAVPLGDVWLATAGPLDPRIRLVSIVGLASAAAFTPISYFYSHRRRRTPGQAFLYLQAVLDVLLVTGIVHITGGSEGVLPPLLYIALVSGYSLLLPLGSALLVALGTGVAYLVEIAVAYPAQLDASVSVQVVIFTLVAMASGVIAGRLRQVGQELTTVEGELRRLQLGTADILRTLDSAVVTLDERGRAAYLNPAAEELLDVQAGEWLGRDLLSELEDRAPEVAAAARETLEERSPVRNREGEILRPDGNRPVSVDTSLLRRTSVPPSITLVLHDMRMARQLEHLRLRTSRLEAVAELSASLAHEIRNPLASIRSAVEQLAAVLPGADEDEAMLTRLIVREADRLSRLLGEFNDFARVDVVQRRPLDVRRLVQEAVELVRQRPESLGRAEFEVRVEGRLADLWGDPDLIHRTLVNLLLNAVQVGDPEEPVRVLVVADSLRPALVARDVSLGAPVRIRVIDDGPGIDPEDLGRIFDPFYTRRSGGSGMGLAIAHRAVQAHGGALLVSSEPGDGATFAIILPRREWRKRKELEAAGWPGETERGEEDRADEDALPAPRRPAPAPAASVEAGAREESRPVAAPAASGGGDGSGR